MCLRLFILIATTFCLSGCSLLNAEQDPKGVFSNPEVYAALDELTDAIRNKDPDRIIQLMHPKIAENKEVQDELRQMLEAIDAEMRSVELYFAENRYGQGEYEGLPIYAAAYDVVLDDGFGQILVAVTLLEGECCVGSYFNFTPTDAQPSKYHSLTLVGKGPTHYAIMGLMVGLPVLMGLTALICLFDKSTRRKWLWIPFILVGLWGITFNWTTGELQPSFFVASGGAVQVKIIQFQLLGVGVATTGWFRPWIVEIGLPLGMILYWLFPRIRARKQEQPDTATSSSD